jgi:hypothetical protein
MPSDAIAKIRAVMERLPDEHAPVVCISAFMPRALKEEFAELAADHDRSFSAELRQAMASWLERHEAERRAA